MESRKDNCLIIRLIFYLIITVSHLLIYFYTYIRYDSIFYNCLFLTRWSLYANTIYFFYKLLSVYKIFSKYKYEERFFRFNFNLSFLVCFLYWMMRFNNPDDLSNKKDFLPIPIDLLMHGGNFLFNLFELLTNLKKISNENNYFSWKFNFLCCINYILMLKWVNVLTGYVLYSFIEERGLFYLVVIGIIGYALMSISDFIYVKVSSYESCSKMIEQKIEK